MRPINTSPVSVSSLAMTLPEKSPWHSPLPYLFGGLAAMLGLISFALLILACSYWRLPGRLNNDEGDERDLESGEKEGIDAAKQPKVYEEKILVIMAGQEKPTFLATPVTTKASSFNAKNGKTEKNEGSAKVESSEKVKTEAGNHEDEQNPTPVEETENEQQTQENH